MFPKNTLVPSVDDYVASRLLTRKSASRQKEVEGGKAVSTTVVRNRRVRRRRKNEGEEVANRVRPLFSP